MKEDSHWSKTGDRKKERRITGLLYLYWQHKPKEGLSSLVQRFIRHPLLRLTKFQFLGTFNEFNMTSSHQNSNIFCCGVCFSQEWSSRIGQNHKISSSSLSRNVSILLLTKKIYSKITTSRVISCSINQENIISNKKADVTEYSYRITKWMMKALERCLKKWSNYQRSWHARENSRANIWYANMFKNHFSYGL